MGTSVLDSSGVAAAAAAALAATPAAAADGPEAVGRIVWQSSRTGKAHLAAKAAREVTTAATVSPRLVNEKQTDDFDGGSEGRASAPSESAGTLTGTETSRRHRAHNESAVRVREANRDDDLDIRRFRSLFTAGKNDPFAADAKVQSPAVRAEEADRDGDLDIRRFRSLFTAGNNDPFTANVKGSCPEEKHLVVTALRPPPREVPRFHSEGRLDGIGLQADKIISPECPSSPAAEQASTAKCGKLVTAMLKYDEKWNENFSKLQAFHSCNGHCNLPQKNEAYHTLRRWVVDQRFALKQGKLKPDRVARLSAIGFQSSPRKVWSSKRWSDQFSKLQAVHSRNGHYNVPRRNKEDPKLGQWVSVQRTLLRQGKLEPEREVRLSAIGFQANSSRAVCAKHEAHWSEQYSKLQAFHARNGHCKVPHKYEADSVLGRWVAKQRNALKEGKVKPDRVARLSVIGLNANPESAPSTAQEEKWSDQYSKLQAFHLHNGHCNVPQSYAADRSLGQWVMNQRSALKKGNLKPDRAALLDAIEFQADPLTDKWNAMCSKLEIYHARYGHYGVPYQTDPALAKWIQIQRRNLEQGTLKDERAARLNRIGFRL